MKKEKKSNSEVEEQLELTPFDITRNQTPFLKFPFHFLSPEVKKINFETQTEFGVTEEKWELVPNPDIGVPKALSYNIDKIVIEKCIYEAGKPLPAFIRIGSLREIAKELGHTSPDTSRIKKALEQNSAMTVRGRIGITDFHKKKRKIDISGSRYNVIFTGDEFPNGSKSDAVYISVNEPFRQIINTTLDRPMDHAYLRILSPSSMRYYEVMSYYMYAALSTRRRKADILYSDLCKFSGIDRKKTYAAMIKQMREIHRPHIENQYIEKKVQYKKILQNDDEHELDWRIYYIPGARAMAQFQVFQKKRKSINSCPLSGFEESFRRLSQQADNEKEQQEQQLDLPLGTSEKPAKLVGHFYELRGIKNPYPTEKELSLAQKWIDEHDYKKALYVVDFSHEAAKETNYTPRSLAGIQQYRAEAIQDYDRQQEKQQRSKKEKATTNEQKRLAQERQKRGEHLFTQLSSTEQDRLLQEEITKILSETPMFRTNPKSRIVIKSAKARVIEHLLFTHEVK